MNIVHKSTAPFLVILLLGLAAALYFIFTPTDSANDDGAQLPVNEMELVDGLDGEASAVGSQVEDPAIAIHRESTSPTDADAAIEILTQVTVLHPDGSGAEGVRILPWMGEEFFDETFTDEAGNATLKGLQGSGGIFIAAPNRLDNHIFQEFGTEPIVVHLIEGLSVSGRVTFKRPRVFKDSFELRLRSIPELEIEGIPKRIRQRLYGKRLTPGWKTLPIDDNGEFKFIGLPKGWHGRLNQPPGYVICSVVGSGLVDEPSLLLVNAPAKLDIEFLELPAFSGRLVSPDGTVGIARHSFEMVVRLAYDPDDFLTLRPMTDTDGFFHAPIYGHNQASQYCADPDSISAFQVQLVIPEKDGLVGPELELDLTQEEDPWDLGEIRMQMPDTLAFRAVDQEGKPIAGAIAYGSIISAPTDEDGYGEVFLASTTEMVRVSAKDYDSVEKKIEDDNSEVMTFVLPQAVRLHLSWTVADGVEMNGMTLQIQSEEHVFAFGDGVRDTREGEIRHRLGLMQNGGRRSGVEEATRAGFMTGLEQREIDIWGLKPGIPMKVMFVGRMHGIIVESETLIFTPGEQRDLEVHIPNGPVDLSGKVMDATGAPLSGARVSITSPRGSGWGTSTATDGSFELESLAWKTLKLQVEMNGFATVRNEEFEIPQDGSPVEFTLHPEREVMVYFRGASGKAFTSATVESPHGNPIEGDQADGGYKFTGVPDNEFPFTWSIGGLRVEQWVPAKVAELVVEVPAMASAKATVKRTATSATQSVRVQFVLLEATEGLEVGSEFNRTVRLVEGQESITKEFPELLPGRYQVKCYVWRGDGIWAWEYLKEQGPFEAIVGQPLELVLEF